MQDIDSAVSDLRKAIEYSQEDTRKSIRIRLSKTFYNAERYDESIDGKWMVNFCFNGGLAIPSGQYLRSKRKIVSASTKRSKKERCFLQITDFTRVLMS